MLGTSHERQSFLPLIEFMIRRRVSGKALTRWPMLAAQAPILGEENYRET